MSSSRDYIKRLEALNGGPLQHTSEKPVEVEEVRRKLEKRRSASPRPAEPPLAPMPEAILYRRDLPRAGAKSTPAVVAGQPVVLEETVQGVEITVSDRGCAYLIESPLVGTFGHAWRHLCASYLDEFGTPDSYLQQHLSAACSAGPFLPHDVLFIDIESTGLGHSPLFLIGSLTWEGDDLLIRQYLARTYAEEPAVTARFLEDAKSKKLLVSFNGKSFDLPYIRARAAATGVPFTLAPAHFDLLHAARRLWRGRLPNCKLQTLERHLCGRHRTDDIPGAEIPDAYHEYVRTGNAAQIVQILKHNLLDLVTLAELTVKLPKEK